MSVEKEQSGMAERKK